MAVDITLRLITAGEYAKMREVGILGEDDRVELIAGEIRQMSSIGPLHAAIVNRLAEILITFLKASATVGIQGPIQLDDLSVPQPDLVVIKRRKNFYADSLPTAQDTLLVIEVSDSTEDYDRKEKMPRYAQAGIPEAWLVNLSNQTIEQFTNPRQSRYSSVQILQPEDLLRSVAVNDLVLPVESVFGMA